MNPEKMRSEYGKLMYLLQVRQIATSVPVFFVTNSRTQDSASPHVQELLNFSCIAPIRCACYLGYLLIPDYTRSLVSFAILILLQDGILRARRGRGVGRFAR